LLAAFIPMRGEVWESFALPQKTPVLLRRGVASPQQNQCSLCLLGT
jgi:hypothetical protein